MKTLSLNIIKVTGVIVICFLISQMAFSANRFSRADGTWSTTNGGSNCGCTPGQNDNITVNHNITLAGPFVLNTGSMTVNAGVLTIFGGTSNGSLTFNNGSTVFVAQGATIHITGNFLNKNNSNHIIINGAMIIDNNFQNGTGSGTVAVLSFGPNASISIGGSCSNPGTVNDNSGAYSGCSNGVLPVNLLFFEGSVLKRKVLLTWATSMEENFNRFSVERSTDGDVFSEIGSVQGIGETGMRNDYSFEDISPVSGRMYCRLKAVDLMGILNISIQSQ